MKMTENRKVVLCYYRYMHEMDDERVYERVIASLESQLKTRLTKLAVGNEFYVFRGNRNDGSGSPIVVKVPKDRVFSNVNDAHIDSRVLLDQEFALMRHIKAEGMRQVPEPIGDIEAEGFGALIMSYVSSDDSDPDKFELGKLLASIHDMRTPEIKLSAQEDEEIPELIANRLHRRWRELANFVKVLPALPSHNTIVSNLEPTRPVKSLLHMDYRRSNFRMSKGRIVALLDWSNALVGHPALELARVAETGETGKTGDEFLRGYSSIKTLPKVSPIADTILRLDTATMLALVFLSEDPDPQRGPIAIRRVLELSRSLG